jgi:hypothetical protein
MRRSLESGELISIEIGRTWRRSTARNMPLTAERKLKQANHNGAMEICWSAQTRNRGQVMLGGDAAAGTLAVPIWLAGAAAAVFVVAILLAVKRAGGVALITSRAAGRRQRLRRPRPNAQNVP